MTVTRHNGNAVIKCTAEGNNYPPQIFWKTDDGPEILGKFVHFASTFLSYDS